MIIVVKHFLIMVTWKTTIVNISKYLNMMEIVHLMSAFSLIMLLLVSLLQFLYLYLQGQLLELLKEDDNVSIEK